MKAHFNQTFNLQHAIHAITQQLRITKQKTTKITFFEESFGKKCNTPVSNITTKSNSKNLINSKIIKHYLDEDTIPGRSHLTDEQCAHTRLYSDVKIEIILLMLVVMRNNRI